MRHTDRYQTRGGFTLIELLVFIAIFTIVVAAFIAILVSIVNIQSEQVGINEDETQGLFVEQQLQYYIQSARIVDMTLDSATSTLTLRESNSVLDPTTVTFSSGTLYLKQGTGGALQPLTSGKVTVSNVSFTRHYNLNGSSSVMGADSVSYSFTLTGGTGATLSSQTFQSSAAVLAPVPTIALLQQAKGENNSASVSSIVTAYPTQNERGDLLIVVAIAQSVGATGVSDTAGDTWRTLQSTTNSVGDMTVYSALATSTATNTITASFGSGAGYASVFLYEYRGPATSSAFTTAGNAVEHTSAPSSSAVYPTANLELLFGIDYGENISSAPSAGSGYILETSSTINNTTQIFVEDAVQYVSGPAVSTWQYSSAVTSTPVIFALP